MGLLVAFLCWVSGFFCCFKICNEQNGYKEIDDNNDLPPRYEDIT